MTDAPARTRRVRIIGIGTGDPEQLTGEAVAALRSVDYVVAAAKGQDDPLLAVRAALCARYDVPLMPVADPERDRDDPADYPGAVRDWHAARVAAYERVLRERPGDAGFLVWGDPAFYDSTLRIVDRLSRRLPLEYDVLPGLSALQLLAARHRVVLHEVGRTILVTTGRRLAEAVAAGHDNIVVFLDGRLACLELPLEEQAEWQVWWAANLGTPAERLVAGRLDRVGDDLRAARAAAAETAEWVMDTYLLRRTSLPPTPDG